MPKTKWIKPSPSLETLSGKKGKYTLGDFLGSLGPKKPEIMIQEKPKPRTSVARIESTEQKEKVQSRLWFALGDIGPDGASRIAILGFGYFTPRKETSEEVNSELLDSQEVSEWSQKFLESQGFYVPEFFSVEMASQLGVFFMDSNHSLPRNWQWDSYSRDAIKSENFMELARFIEDHHLLWKVNLTRKI